MSAEEFWFKVAQEVIAALRGHRSRAQFSRRLGYSTNTVSDWEAGRRMPTAEEFLGICERESVDVDAAFARFQPATASLLRDGERITLHRWLEALRGSTSLRIVGDRSGLSRFSVSRFLRGSTRPRLHEFLQLVQALTYRAADLVGALVDVEKMPKLLEEHRRRQAARELAFTHPDSQAVLRMMETERYMALRTHVPGILAASIGIEATYEGEILATMERAAVIRRSAEGYQHGEPLTIDTSTEPTILNRVKGHWTETALKRLQRGPLSDDWFGYNVMSLSDRDLEQARMILVRAYREIRALAAASKPVQIAALLNIQLVTLPVTTEQ